MNYMVRTASDPARLAGPMRQALPGSGSGPAGTGDRDHGPPGVAHYRRAAFQARLLGAFSLLALLLAAVGVYGVLAYSVAERTREIGIRMALGAAAPDVIRMILRRTLLLVFFGIAAGIAGAAGGDPRAETVPVRRDPHRHPDICGGGGAARRGSAGGRMGTGLARDPRGPVSSAALRVK